MIGVAAVALVAAIAPAAEMTEVERLNAELLAGRTATEVLERRCAALKLADPPRVWAEVKRDRVLAEASPARTQLDVGKSETLGYRRVRLMCGNQVLSEAINWYVIDRLTPEMNAALDTGDTPFGRVILPLQPRRRTLSTWMARPGKSRGDVILRHRAIVLGGDGRPLAFVIENYQRILTTAR